MKKIACPVFVALLAFLPSGFAKSPSKHPRAKVTERVRLARENALPPVGEGPISPRGTSVGGALPKAIRSEDPVMMIDPFAPPAYGSGAQYVVDYPDKPGVRTNGPNRQSTPQGFRLITIRPNW